MSTHLSSFSPFWGPQHLLCVYPFSHIFSHSQQDACLLTSPLIYHDVKASGALSGSTQPPLLWCTAGQLKFWAPVTPPLLIALLALELGPSCSPNSVLLQHLLACLSVLPSFWISFPSLISFVYDIYMHFCFLTLTANL